MNFFGICNECGEEVEINQSSLIDAPIYCPECFAIDSIEELENES